MLAAIKVYAYVGCALVELRLTTSKGPAVSQLLLSVLQAIKSEGGFVWACK